jgi:hypothetical protein
VNNAPRRRPQHTHRMRFAREGEPGEAGVLLDLPREDALDLLEWLGLGRPEFGRIAVRELAPLCRRRLWPMPRNVDEARAIADAAGYRTDRRAAGTLHAWTEELLGSLANAESAVLFG